MVPKDKGETVAILDKDLVRCINTGRAFLLVGSGPSSAAGVQSWRLLAEEAQALALNSPNGEDVRVEIELALRERQYPTVFELAARVVGLDQLCGRLSGSLTANVSDVGPVYPLLAEWPIATYLTTNFDDLLRKALMAAKEAYVTRGNSHDEMRTLRADTTGEVFKLHGSLEDPANVVLTSRQYAAFVSGSERTYWRDTLFSILRNVDVIVVGYSVSDPNFKDQLKWAKENSHPDRPIFMFTTGLSDSEVDSLYQEYNIRAIQYENPHGDHRELVRLLRRYDPFIARRRSGDVGLPAIDEDQVGLASSLYVFTRSRLDDTDESCLERTYCALVLDVLARTPDQPMTLSDVGAATERAANSAVDPQVLHRAVERLYQLGYVSWDPEMGVAAMLPRGADLIATTRAEGNSISDRFDVACLLYLESLEQPVAENDATIVIDSLKRGLVSAFEKRGLEIAQAVLADGGVRVSDASDILAVINKYGDPLPTLQMRAAFADLTIRVLLEPTAEMKAYLASTAQGYFAYHALGWEPQAAQERLSLARQTTWIVDASVLLWRLAEGCANHKYAEDLMSRMRELGIRCVTTERLLDEIEGHARWAITDYVGKGLDSLELLKAVVASPGHRQNLFVDGFAHWAVDKGAPTLAQYMVACIGTSKSSELRVCLASRLEELGVDVVPFEDWGYVASHAEAFAERDGLFEQIRTLRQERGTFKNDDQCVAEAEVLVVARHENVSFLTMSNVLRGLAGIERRVNWQPEALYRFISLLSAHPQDAETLFESMTQTFFHCGFDIVDREMVTQYAKGLAHQARLQVNDAREKYAGALSDKDFGELAEAFERVPDEQKPFYAMQFAHYVATKAAERALAAEKRVAVVEARARLTTEERDRLAKLEAKEAERKKKGQKVARRNASKPSKKRRRR